MGPGHTPGEYSLLAQLAGNALLKGVPDDLLNRIAAHGKLRALAPGDILLTPDQENTQLYLLLSGRLAVHFGSPDSAEISQLDPGVSVGEISVIDGTPPTAYVIAKMDCQVFAIARELVIELVESANPVAHNLLRQITRWVKTNKQHFMHARVRIEELTNDAHLDALTGLYNRRWLDRALPRLLEVDHPQCLILLDVDRFKHFNDTYGHLGGDQALITLANVLKTTLRPYDYAARYGGDEFVILLPNDGLNGGTEVAERIRSSIASHRICHADGSVLSGITVSLGMAQHVPGMAPESLIAEADRQLYLAKAKGRNALSHDGQQP